MSLKCDEETDVNGREIKTPPRASPPKELSFNAAQGAPAVPDCAEQPGMSKASEEKESAGKPEAAGDAAKAKESNTTKEANVSFAQFVNEGNTTEEQKNYMMLQMAAAKSITEPGKAVQLLTDGQEVGPWDELNDEDFSCELSEPRKVEPADEDFARELQKEKHHYVM